MPTITFNGKTYSGIEAMPPDVRSAYEQLMSLFADKNQNGIPDFLEGSPETNISIQTTSISSNPTQIVVDGQTYTSPEEMPPEARQKYEKALLEIRQLGENNPTLANILSGIPSPNQAAPSASSTAPTATAHASKPLISSSTPPVVSDATSGTNRLLLIIGLIVILVAVFAIVFLLAAR